MDLCLNRATTTYLICALCVHCSCALSVAAFIDDNSFCMVSPLEAWDGVTGVEPTTLPPAIGRKAAVGLLQVSVLGQSVLCYL